MKKLSIRQMAAIKRTAMNVNPLVIKRNKLQEKINAMTQEVQELQQEIEGHEMGVISATGHCSGDLVKKVVETTDKLDKDGNPVKITKYVPTDTVTFSEDENCYYINDIEAPAATEFGSDFDLDTNKIEE